MSDPVHVTGEGDINRVLPHIVGYREDVGVSADRSRRQIGGDVEERIQSPKFPGGELDEFLISRFVRDIEPTGDGISTCGCDLINLDLGGGRIEICRNHLRSFLSQTNGRGTADIPRCRAGNDRYFVAKSPHRALLARQ